MRELQSYHNLIYIFLDVDGVLNDENYIVKCYERDEKKTGFSLPVRFDRARMIHKGAAASWQLARCLRSWTAAACIHQAPRPARSHMAFHRSCR